VNKIPTSNIDEFRQHLLNPNKPFDCQEQNNTEIMKLKKNLVVAYFSDSTGCGHIRALYPMNYLNAIYGKTGKFNILISPTMIFQQDILMRTRAIFFQRTMNPGHVQAVKTYQENRAKFGYKMIYDIDDFIFSGPDEGESIPEYNFGKQNISPEVMKSCIEIMNMMDIVCVSTQFLGDYIKSHGVDKPEIKVIHNTIPQYFWGPNRKRPITSKIEKPRILWSGSPTHWNQQKRLKGDMENAWCEWIIKNITDNKIEFMQMGGLPFFFESIQKKPNFKYINWVNSYQYHLPIKTYRPDFMIGPLVPNYFNYSKSNIKAIEAYAAGALFIGSTWKGTNYSKFPSPYDDCPVNIPYNISVDELNKTVWNLTKPENYNPIIQQQYKILDNEGRWLESEKFVKTFTNLFE